MKRTARENKQRVNKQLRTERLYSGASEVPQLGLAARFKSLSNRVPPRIQFAQVVGCLGKRPTGEVNSGGFGEWAKAEIK